MAGLSHTSHVKVGGDVLVEIFVVASSLDFLPLCIGRQSLVDDWHGKARLENILGKNIKLKKSRTQLSNFEFFAEPWLRLKLKKQEF